LCSEQRAPSTRIGAERPGQPARSADRDEPTIIEFLRTGLSYEGFRAVTATDGRTDLRLASEQEFALVILDLMLPDLDGFEVCRRLRARGREVPIIMLTARKEIPDKVAGLGLGADDYVTKPFSFEELLARIQAVLRRRGTVRESNVLSAAGLTLNPDTHEVYKGGEMLDLTPIEFALLELFMRHPRRVFTRETLLNRIWGFDHAGDTNVVDVHISHLRQKIGESSRRVIRTVYGLGYTFRPDDGSLE
jgi:DNA-binding response OmpR family regulator